MNDDEEYAADIQHRDVLNAIEKIQSQLDQEVRQLDWLEEAYARMLALVEKIAQGLGIDPKAD